MRIPVAVPCSLQGWRLIRGGDAFGRERLQQQIDADLGAAAGVALRATFGEAVYADLLAAVVAARAG
jgi:hypothetical protein